jgi:uncharacterized membrane protein YcaP (DUF421 family)
MDILIRSVALFFFLFLIIRAMGRRELSELSSFELILMIVVGDLIQQGVTGDDRSVTGAIVAVSTFAMLSVAMSYASFRWRRASPVLEGVPVILIRHGEVLTDVLKVERMTHDELDEELRNQGIRDPSIVALGVLEADGTFSFIREDGASPQDPPAQAEL